MYLDSMDIRAFFGGGTPWVGRKGEYMFAWDPSPQTPLPQGERGFFNPTLNPSPKLQGGTLPTSAGMGGMVIHQRAQSFQPHSRGPTHWRGGFVALGGDVA